MTDLYLESSLEARSKKATERSDHRAEDAQSERVDHERIQVDLLTTKLKLYMYIKHY